MKVKRIDNTIKDFTWKIQINVPLHSLHVSPKFQTDTESFLAVSLGRLYGFTVSVFS